MSDPIITKLGALSAVGQAYPVQSKSSGSHSITVSLAGTGALVFVGALMGSNDNKNWAVAAAVSASGNGTAVGTAQTTTDYAFWALAATSLTGTGVVASGVLLTDAFLISPEAEQILASSAFGLSPAVLNFKRANTEVLRSILHLAGAGIERGRIWFMGTSVQVGNGAAAVGWTGNSKAFSYPMLVGKFLDKMGLNARADYSVGDSGSGSFANLKTFDTRNDGSGTTIVGGQSIGGQFVELKQNGTYTFTPGGTFNTVDSSWAINTGTAAQFTISVDGGNTPIGGNISATAGAQAYGQQTTTVPDGSTAVTYKNTSATAVDVFVNMTGCRTAGLPTIEIINAAAGGSTLTGVSGLNWNANSGGAAWGAIGATDAIDASIKNVFVLECLINDAKSNPGVDLFIAAQTAWIKRCQAKGEVYFRIPPTVADSTDGQANFVARAVFNAYGDAARDNAIALGCVVIDERILYPDWATSNALGLFRDGFHGNAGVNNAGARAVISICQHLV